MGNRDMQRLAAALPGSHRVVTGGFRQIRTVDRFRLVKKLGKIDGPTAAAVLDVLREMMSP